MSYFFNPYMMDITLTVLKEYIDLTLEEYRLFGHLL